MAKAGSRDKDERFIRDGLINYFGLAVSGVVGILIVPIMIRGLGTEAYGLWVTAVATAGLFGALDFGLGWAVTREVSGSVDGITGETELFVVTVGNAYFLLGVLSALLIAAVGLPLGGRFNLSPGLHRAAPTIFALAGAAHLADWLLDYSASVLGGLRRFGLLNVMAATEAVVRGLGVVVLLRLEFSFVQVVAWLAAWKLVIALVSVLVVGHVEPRYRLRLGHVHWRSVVPHLPFSIASQVSMAVYQFIWQAATLMIPFLRGAAALVPYHVGQRFPVAVQGFNQSGAEVIYPASSAEQRSEDVEARQQMLLIRTRWNALVALPACVIFAIFAPALLTVWLGQASQQSIAVMRVTSLAVLVNGLGVPAMYMLWARGAVRHILAALTGGAIFTIICTVMLLGTLGVSAGAVGLLIGVTLFSMVFLREAARTAGLSTTELLRRSLGGMGIPTTLCGTVGLALAYIAEPTRWATTIACTAVSGACFLGTFYVLGATEEERELMRHLFQIPAAAARVVCRALRSQLRRLPPVRSAYYFLLTVKELSRASHRGIRKEIRRDFQSEDPWGFFRANEQERFANASELLSEAAAGGRIRRALEIGCAEGIFTQMLANRCEFLVAADFSGIALERARQRNRDAAHVSFTQWDVLRDSLPGEFDLIVLMAVLEYFRRPWWLRNVREKLARGMRPGAHLLLSNTKQGEPLETYWWGRYMLCGARWIDRFMAGDPRFEIVATKEGEFYTQMLLRRK